jgi:hypothetical protein
MLAIRRKKSQSLADLHQNSTIATIQVPRQRHIALGNVLPLIRHCGHCMGVTVAAQDKACGPSKHEESGYDSDTRKSAETVSPKSSDKSDESDSAETSGSFTSEEREAEVAGEPHYQIPRRGAKDLRPVTPQKPPRRSRGQGDEGSPAGRCQSSPGTVGGRRERSTSAGSRTAPALPTLTQKNFTMMRLVKDQSNELGIIISRYLLAPAQR